MKTSEAGGDYHVPVLAKEVIQALQIKPDGTYVDCTFGGGGHSGEILKLLNSKGRIFAFDQDADARQNLPADERIIFLPHNFKHLHRFLRLHQVVSVQGLLADLGVSSHQFDEPERGFSTRAGDKLDMRMDQRQEFTAASILKDYSEERLQKIFELYGEVTNAKTLAKRIVQARSKQPLNTLVNFKAALEDIVKGNPHKYFAKVFQALRIEVNDELGALQELLQQIPMVLETGARAAIISFHSLEDRLVKNFFRHGNFEDEQSANPFEQTTASSQLKIITKKPVTASEQELKLNPRSRSAKLRVAEKL